MILPPSRHHAMPSTSPGQRSLRRRLTFVRGSPMLLVLWAWSIAWLLSGCSISVRNEPGRVEITIGTPTGPQSASSATPVTPDEATPAAPANDASITPDEATPAAPANDGSIPAQVVDLINQERIAAGCPALTPNPTLMQVAEDHSQDMARNDYFDHTALDGRSPFDRMSDAGYDYSIAAENIAAGRMSPAEVVAGWMDSPGHRENILNCELRETGVGYIVDPNDSLNYGAYWTQVFGTP